ncbi:hypothetical protein [Natranaerobius trueperi]|uniref:Uncharacterized protein n=1 Tax=Natranaerobius trueperi TaxID=759412 RepID=A0A226BVI0_9FIRM|nr:hypothetical protein [Natranaerobius trueperi]OWZ83058.1 hypothetical protein CDO51_10515 [Natranaerobius trueperi]
MGDIIVMIIILLGASAVKNVLGEGRTDREKRTPGFPRPQNEQETQNQEKRAPNFPWPEDIEFPSFPNKGQPNVNKHPEEEEKSREIREIEEERTSLNDTIRDYEDKKQKARKKARQVSAQMNQLERNSYQVSTRKKDSDLQEMFSSKKELKNAILLKEILDPPKSKKKRKNFV